jgi:hypothetical protein
MPMGRKLKNIHRGTIIFCITSLILALFYTLYAATSDEYYPYKENRWFVDLGRFQEGSHGRLECDICHKDLIAQDKRHPDQGAVGFLTRPAIERFDYAICDRCHPIASQNARKGAHWELPTRKKAPESLLGRLPQPQCGHCHDSHYDKVMRDPVELGRRTVERCGLCHREQVISYLEDVHGRKAYFLRDNKAPFCSDCHSAHHVLSLKEKATALEVCQRCHREAGIRFTEAVIHKYKKAPTSPAHPKEASVTLLRLVGTVALVIVGAIIVFSFFHTLLWLLRDIQKALKKRR